MYEVFKILLIILLIYYTNLFLLKKNLIPNFSGNSHQQFFDKKNVPLSGGIYLFFVFLYIFLDAPYYLMLFFFLIFLIGLLSDKNYISSVLLRFVFQSFIVFFFVYLLNVNIESVRIDSFDVFLQNFIISCLFTSFCLIILINGTNFIDGVNGLVISYYIIILFILFRLNLWDNMYLDTDDLLVLFTVLIFLLLLNFFNKLFLGDSGSYLISFIFGFLLISVFKTNQLISPYFIAVLLWYPAFEILFSIFRKLFFNKSPVKPDNNHFHHLLFYFIKKKFNYQNTVSNNLSSLIIVVYNFVIFNFATLNIFFTYFQISIILFNVTIYLLIYFVLLNYRLKIKL